MTKQIVITIPQFGAPKVEAVGFNGVGCAEATKGYEAILSGGATEKRDYKPEWSNPEDTTETQDQRVTW